MFTICSLYVHHICHDENVTLLSNSCKASGNTAKDEHKYQPIFLLVCSGSLVTKSQVYQYTKIELYMSRARPNTFYCFTFAHLVEFYPTS